MFSSFLRREAYHSCCAKGRPGGRSHLWQIHASQRSNKAVKHTKIDMLGRVVYLDLLHVEQVLHNLEDEGIAITK